MFGRLVRRGGKKDVSLTSLALKGSRCAPVPVQSPFVGTGRTWMCHTVQHMISW